MGLEGEVDEELEERMRQEEREREQKTLELLERRIGVDDGSLKRLGKFSFIRNKRGSFLSGKCNGISRENTSCFLYQSNSFHVLGEKVETIEKETIQQKDKEAALRQQEKEDELARKEEERRAYEEVL